MQSIINKLIDIKDDVDAIDHHQSDRIVSEIKQVIEDLKKKSEASSASSAAAVITDQQFPNPAKSDRLLTGVENQISLS